MKPKLEFKHRSKYKGKGLFKWRVHVVADKQTLDSIDFVRYILHETFKNPVRDIDDKSSKFALKSQGWGNFTILILVYFKDGSVFKTKHYLKLDWESVPREDKHYWNDRT